jgi:hypothetical protein
VEWLQFSIFNGSPYSTRLCRTRADRPGLKASFKNILFLENVAAIHNQLDVRGVMTDKNRPQRSHVRAGAERNSKNAMALQRNAAFTVAAKATDQKRPIGAKFAGSKFGLPDAINSTLKAGGVVSRPRRPGH